MAAGAPSFRPAKEDTFALKKNRAVSDIIRDFPWLWRVLDYWSGDQAEKVKVSQDMAHLRLALLQPSGSTRFEFWVFADVPCDLIAWRVIRVERDNKKNWAEVMRGQISIPLLILENLVLVDPRWAGDVAPAITIFRNPDKHGLNEVVQEVLSMTTGRP